MAKTKEPQQPTSKSPVQRVPGPRQPAAAGRYFREVRSEINKVVWPSREQATNLTLIVMAVMVTMGIFLGLLDLIFGGLIQLLVNTLA